MEFLDSRGTLYHDKNTASVVLVSTASGKSRNGTDFPTLGKTSATDETKNIVDG
jgi:hypothetical protein